MGHLRALLREVDMRKTAKLFVRRYRSEMLLCSLIAQLLASPLADRSPHIGGLLAFAQLLLVLAAATYMANRKSCSWQFLRSPVSG